MDGLPATTAGRRDHAARPEPLLAIRDLRVTFEAPEGAVRAVDGVSLDVGRGEIVALVGESGSGKSVTMAAVMRLVPEPPGRIAGGSIRFDGRELRDLDERAMHALRGDRIGFVSQEPMTSLNPLLSLGRQITETMRFHLGIGRGEARRRAVALLGSVGIGEPERRLRQYPHHLSGGMRQRVIIAMALSCDPELVIADEPTTALDVTIQAQILELLQGLCAERGVALVIVTHNLGVVARYADQVSVMYAGRIVEQGPAAELYRSPAHPYTLGLLNSVPRMDRPRAAAIEPIPGAPPDPAALPAGCAFRPRCGFAARRCAEAPPPLEAVAPGRSTACFETARVQEAAR